MAAQGPVALLTGPCSPLYQNNTGMDPSGYDLMASSPWPSFAGAEYAMSELSPLPPSDNVVEDADSNLSNEVAPLTSQHLAATAPGAVITTRSQTESSHNKGKRPFHRTDMPSLDEEEVQHHSNNRPPSPKRRTLHTSAPSTSRASLPPFPTVTSHTTSYHPTTEAIPAAPAVIPTTASMPPSSHITKITLSDAPSIVKTDLGYRVRSAAANSWLQRLDELRHALVSQRNSSHSLYAHFLSWRFQHDASSGTSITRAQLPRSFDVNACLDAVRCFFPSKPDILGGDFSNAALLVQSASAENISSESMLPELLDWILFCDAVPTAVLDMSQHLPALAHLNASQLKTRARSLELAIIYYYFLLDDLKSHARQSAAVDETSSTSNASTLAQSPRFTSSKFWPLIASSSPSENTTTNAVSLTIDATPFGHYLYGHIDEASPAKSGGDFLYYIAPRSLPSIGFMLSAEVFDQIVCSYGGASSSLITMVDVQVHMTDWRPPDITNSSSAHQERADSFFSYFDYIAYALSTKDIAPVVKDYKAILNPASRLVYACSPFSPALGTLMPHVEHHKVWDNYRQIFSPSSSSPTLSYIANMRILLL